MALPEMHRISWVRNAWLAAVAGTAVAGFGLLALNYNPAGPLSEYNRGRLHNISAIVPATTGQGGAFARPRLFCAMIHIEQSRQVRQAYAAAVKDTWGRHCDGLLLWDERHADIAAFDLEASLQDPPTDSPVQDRWLRYRRMWRHIAQHKIHQFDWFVAVDDGGFVIIENLLRVIATLGPNGVGGNAIDDHSTHTQSNKPVYLVETGGSTAWGNVMNAAALSELMIAFGEHHTNCPMPSRNMPDFDEYSLLYGCLEKGRGLQPFRWQDSKEVRKILGCKDVDQSVVNLKMYAKNGTCRHAVLAYMVPTPSWMREIYMAIYDGS